MTCYDGDPKRWFFLYCNLSNKAERYIFLEISNMLYLMFYMQIGPIIFLSSIHHNSA